MAVTPFKVDIPQERLDWIHKRLKNADWPDVPVSDDPWAYGCSAPAMRAFVDYLLNQYDWRKEEAKLNRFPQFKAKVEDYEIHFIHVKGSGRNPQPIIMTHGWPGTFAEFVKVIEPLAHPEKFGGKEEDSFDVVVPSIPGFAFSSKPPKPINTRKVAYLFDKLMVEALGYDSYIAQGHDYGSPTSIAMAHDSPHCKAAHLNFLLGVVSPPVSDEEKAAFARWNQVMQTEGGYIAIQGTKPLTLSYAMTDSPLGVTAWIFEKFKTWAQTKNGDPWSVFTKDEVATQIMLYLVTNTFGTASWMYRGEPEGGPPPQDRIEKPFAVAHFPGELVTWPRSYAERMFKLVRWTEMPEGGHFAAMEKPQLVIDDIRAFGRQLRTA